MGAGSLVRGVPLTLRADSTAVWIGLLACAACLLVLCESRRAPLERAALLLCLAGTLIACVAGGAVLLVAGLELGNAGALLLTVAAPPAARRQAQMAFGIQHIASLGLLAAALELIHAQQSAALAGLPPSAVGAGVAVPWAVCGLVRLAGVIALPGRAAGALSCAWVAVTAVPSGLVVLLRLAEITGGDLAAAVPVAAHLLLAGGLLVALGGAVVALREREHPAAAGRALCLSTAGQVAALVGAGGPGALGAAAAMAVALLLATLAAPAWTATPPWLRALALATAAGLPCGAGTAALLAGTGAEVAPGGIPALAGTVAALIGILAGVAGALAVGATLAEGAHASAPRSTLRRLTQVRVDAAAALLASAVLAFLPGSLLGGLADRIAGSAGATTAIDLLAVRGPGFGWAGGYLAVAALIGVVAAVCAEALTAAAVTSPVVEAATPPAAAAPVPVGPAAAMAAAETDAATDAPEPVGPFAGRLGQMESWLLGWDRWLVRQPDVPVILLVGIALLLWFQHRP